MSSLVARISISSVAAYVEVWKDEAGELSLRITGIGENWYGPIDLSPAATIGPGPEHAWVRNRVCDALYSAMGRYGFDKYTKTLISTSPGWHEVCHLANAELAGGRTWSDRPYVVGMRSSEELSEQFHIGGDSATNM